MINDNRPVNRDLYNLIKKNGTEAHLITRSDNNHEMEVGILALIDFNDLQNFINTVGQDYITEAGVAVTLLNGQVAIRIDDIITKYFKHDIEAYKDAVGVCTYKQYRKFLRYQKCLEKNQM